MREEEEKRIEEMDAAASAAGNELKNMILSMNESEKSTVTKIVLWWKKWYMTAGHKRLGRIILELFS